MRVLYLLLISHVSALLQCDKSIIRVTVGKTLNVVCTYKTNQFRFSKKYWCFGESRSTCEILMDTDGFTKAGLKERAQITDAVFRGLHVLMTRIQFSDAGIYWVGIDKIYADIMFQIQVEVTDEAVSRPEVWSVGSAVLTCQGEPLTLSCRSERGTNVQYSWSRKDFPETVFSQSTSDLNLNCATLTQDSVFTCSAHNTVSRVSSKPVIIHVLQPGHHNCIYSLTYQGLEGYFCRMTTPPPVTTTPFITTTMTTAEGLSSTPIAQTSRYENQSLHDNHTWTESFFLRSWSGVPLWYDIGRWTLFTAMIMTIGLVHFCTPTRPNRQSYS